MTDRSSSRSEERSFARVDDSMITQVEFDMWKGQGGVLSLHTVPEGPGHLHPIACSRHSVALHHTSFHSAEENPSHCHMNSKDPS